MKKFENNQQFADSLRELAAFYETHPLTPPPFDLSHASALLCFVHCDTPEETREVFRSLGSFQKQFADDGRFEAIKNVGAYTLNFTVNREMVCERKVTGIRTIPAHVVPERYEPSREVPEHEEEIVEWDCSPVLASTNGDGQ